MDELRKTYQEHENSYTEFLHAFTENKSKGILTKVYASQDVFSLVPYYREMNDISPDKMQLHSHKKTLPRGLDEYECWLEDGNIVYVRHKDMVGMVSDSFFVRSENAVWEYKFYVSGQSPSIAYVQRLIHDTSGRTSRLEFYNKYGSQVTTYSYKQDKVVVENSSNQMKTPHIYTVFINPESGNVDQIDMRRKRHRDVHTVYRASGHGSDETSLLQRAKENIIETVVSTIKSQKNIKEEIAFILFAYHFDYPFPPAVGLCQTTEQIEMTQQYGPLSAYGIAEMEYFSENRNPEFSFGEEELFSELTESLDYNHEYEDKKKVIFDSYVGICKELMANQDIRHALTISDRFHILAQDFSEQNELKYLKALLPNKEFIELEKAVLEFEERIQNQLDYDI